MTCLRVLGSNYFIRLADLLDLELLELYKGIVLAALLFIEYIV